MFSCSLVLSMLVVAVQLQDVLKLVVVELFLDCSLLWDRVCLPRGSMLLGILVAALPSGRRLAGALCPQFIWLVALPFAEFWELQLCLNG